MKDQIRQYIQHRGGIANLEETEKTVLVEMAEIRLQGRVDGLLAARVRSEHRGGEDGFDVIVAKYPTKDLNILQKRGTSYSFIPGSLAAAKKYAEKKTKTKLTWGKPWTLDQWHKALKSGFNAEAK